MKKSKYSNIKVVIDEIKFDSKKEGRRYLELKLQEKTGFISELSLQPEFVLQDSFKRDGKTIRAIKYRADFRYLKDGKIIIEDVKGKKTKEYLLKKKMLFNKYPDINFIET